MQPAGGQPFNPFRTWGLWACIAGGAALMLVFWQIFGPMTEPRPSAATQIGEIAGEIRRSAWRSALGLPRPEAAVQQPERWTAALGLAAPALGILAVLLSVVSGVRGENWRFAAYGTGLGAGAVLFHFVWWIALLVLGILMLIAIIENIGDIFGG